MRTDDAELPDIPRGRHLKAAARPVVLDAEYRVVWAPWRVLRDYWWAFGYLAYCVVLWALAAVVGWVL